MAKAVTLYQHITAAGTVREQIAGFELQVAAGDASGQSATWEIRQATFYGPSPAAGDRFRDADGNWWDVKKVGELASGAWPCECERRARP